MCSCSLATRLRGARHGAHARRARGRALPRRLGSSALAVVALLASGGLLHGSVGAFDRARGLDAAATSSTRCDRVEPAPSVILGAWRSFLFVAARGGRRSLCARAARHARRWRWHSRAIVAVDLWSVERTYWLFSPPRERALRQRSGDRAPQEGAPARTRARTAQPDRDTGSGVRDPYCTDGGCARWSTASAPSRAITATRSGATSARRTCSVQRATASDLVTRRSGATRTRATSTRTRPSPTPRSSCMIGPVQELGGIHRLPLSAAGRQPVRLGCDGDGKAPDSDAAAAVLDPRFDPRASPCSTRPRPDQATPRATLPEPLRHHHARHRATSPATSTSRSARRRRPDRHWSSRRTTFPGWTATVDGRPMPRSTAPTTTSSAFRCRRAHERIARFHDPPSPRGTLITLVAAPARAAALTAPAHARRADGGRDCLSGRSSSSRRTTSGRTFAGSSTPCSAQDGASTCSIVDDGSPDGTGADRRRDRGGQPARPPAVERAKKMGLGTAYIAGFRWALERDYALHPRDGRRLLPRSRPPPAVPRRDRGRRPRARLAVSAGAGDGRQLADQPADPQL